jgi:hypothetical protein
MAEFAAEPRTAPGFTIITPAAVAAAAPRNLLRLIFSVKSSTMNIPPRCFCDDCIAPLKPSAFSPQPSALTNQLAMLPLIADS